jgi:hypothetical protein
MRPATPHLAAAAQKRSQDTRRRAQEALRRLDRAGEPITFAAVAQAASVSRSWLYRQPELRAEIDRLRAVTPPAVPLPSAERTSAESSRRRREAMLAEIQRLKDENRQLREQVARRFGEQRADGTLTGP